VKKLNDKKLRLYGIPALTVILTVPMWDWEPSVRAMSFGLYFGIAFFNDLCGWFACRSVLIYFRKKYPGIQKSRLRIKWSLVTYFAVTSLFILWHLAVLNTLLPTEAHVGFSFWLKESFLVFFCLTLLAGIYEAQYFFEEWNEQQLATKAMEMNIMESKMEALKNQISPHFLFNNLNSLSSLIRSNANEAELFLEELSEVYRYLLRKNNSRLATLQEELDFAASYLHLLKKRYGSGLECKLEIAEDHKNDQLPSMSLQLLIENAVKHNVVSRSNPLHIDIFTDQDGHLIVSNNLQKKQVAVVSTQVGLSSINANYHLLGKPGIVIQQTEQTFSVALPLIKDTEEKSSWEARAAGFTK